MAGAETWERTDLKSRGGGQKDLALLKPDLYRAEDVQAMLLLVGVCGYGARLSCTWCI